MTMIMHAPKPVDKILLFTDVDQDQFFDLPLMHSIEAIFVRNGNISTELELIVNAVSLGPITNNAGSWARTNFEYLAADGGLQPVIIHSDDWNMTSALIVMVLLKDLSVI
jgi:hypothetical protein